MRFHIGWRGERSIPYKGVESSFSQTRFKTLRGNPEGKAQRGQYLLMVGLGCYNGIRAKLRAVCQRGF